MILNRRQQKHGWACPRGWFDLMILVCLRVYHLCQLVWAYRLSSSTIYIYQYHCLFTSIVHGNARSYPTEDACSQLVFGAMQDDTKQVPPLLMSRVIAVHTNLFMLLLFPLLLDAHLGIAYSHQRSESEVLIIITQGNESLIAKREI